MNRWREYQSRISRAWSEYNTYFSDSAQEIATTNLSLIRGIGLLGALLIAVYYGFTALFFPAQMIAPIYLLVLPVLLLIAAAAHYSLRCGTRDPRVAQILSMLFLTTFSAYFIVLSVFPHADEPEVFMSLFIMLMPAVLILHYSQFFALLFSGECAFILLCLRNKSPQVVPHDIFITMTACMLSIIVEVIVYSLRSSDFRRRQHFEILSTLDIPTGLPNKAACEQLCREYFASCPVTEKSALMIVDMDDFKAVNDTLGHRGGDEILRQVGAVMSADFRNGCVIGRIGGDEFLILIKNITDEAAATAQADDLRNHIAAIPGVDSDMWITCSIGIAIRSAGNASFEKMFALADTALYEAKAEGKAGQVVYHATGTSLEREQKPVMVVACMREEDCVALAEAFADRFVVRTATDIPQALCQLEAGAVRPAVLLAEEALCSTDGESSREFVARCLREANVSLLWLSQHQAGANYILLPLNPVTARLRVAGVMHRDKKQEADTDE